MRLIAVSFAALILLAACSGDPDATGTSSSDTGGAVGGNSITAVDNEFKPAELELEPGEEVTITFTNEGETIHTFTSEELGFDTGTVDPGATAEVSFTAPDEETRFVCTIHAETDDMVGTIVPE